MHRNKNDAVTTQPPWSQVALVLVDEVHLLNEAGRGSALEAGVISRIAMVSQVPAVAQVGGWLGRNVGCRM